MARFEFWPWFEATQDTPLENALPNSMPVLYVMPKWFLNSKSHLFMQCKKRKSRRIGGGVLLSIRRLENSGHVPPLRHVSSADQRSALEMLERARAERAALAPETPSPRSTEVKPN
jgi:hypothetical protein